MSSRRGAVFKPGGGRAGPPELQSRRRGSFFASKDPALSSWAGEALYCPNSRSTCTEPRWYHRSREDYEPWTVPTPSQGETPSVRQNRPASPAQQVAAPPQADVQKGTRRPCPRRVARRRAGRAASPRVYWLQPCRVGPTRPAIGCGIDYLHMGRGNWTRLGPDLGVRVATSATEVDPRAGDGPVPGSQVKLEGS